MTMLRHRVAILLILFLTTINHGTAGSHSNFTERSVGTLLSDGKSSLVVEVVDDPLTSMETCEPMYGFLPCATTMWENLYMLVVFQYLLSVSQDCVTRGSHLFFQMFGTGLFGGGLFRVLAIFPQLILVLVSGATSSKEIVQTIASMGMGVLAGSAILMLTLVWGSVLLYASYDLSDTSSNIPSNLDNENGENAATSTYPTNPEEATNPEDTSTYYPTNPEDTSTYPSNPDNGENADTSTYPTNLEETWTYYPTNPEDSWTYPSNPDNVENEDTSTYITNPEDTSTYPSNPDNGNASTNPSNPYYNADTSTSPDDAENNKLYRLTEYGVRPDSKTRLSAKIMLLSMIPYLTLQLAEILSSSPTATRVVVLISLLITLALLAFHSIYQVFQPWIQERSLEYSMHKFIQTNFLDGLHVRNGKADEREIRRLFQRIDKDGDGCISRYELGVYLLETKMEGFGWDLNDFESELMEEFDTYADSKIHFEEFFQAISNRLKDYVTDEDDQEDDKLFNFINPLINFINHQTENDEEKQSFLPKEEKKSEERKGTNNAQKPWWNYSKAFFLIILGTAISVLLASPLMEAIQEFSSSANIPPFLVSYVVVPVALCFRMAIRAIISARKKTKKVLSLTLSELYVGVFMNNVMGMLTFLSLVYIRDIPWGVSAEVLTVLLICTAMGVLAAFSREIKLWTSIIAFILYPITLLLIYVLTNVFGWS